MSTVEVLLVPSMMSHCVPEVNSSWTATVTVTAIVRTASRRKRIRGRGGEAEVRSRVGEGSIMSISIDTTSIHHREKERAV